MIALLDVNVLIARSDRAHQFHHRALATLRAPSMEIATCPLTENGFLRIYGHPSYPGGPGSPVAAARDLAVLRGLPGHRFLPDDQSILSQDIDLADTTPSQITDLYLLALAVRHDAKFVTLDTRIDPAAVKGGTRALMVIPE